MIAADSRVFVGRDTAAGYQQDSTVATLPRGEWFHFAWTMAADGLSGAFYVNGLLLETWSTANAPNNTAISSRFFLGEAWDNVLFGSYYSTIVREKECSAAEVLAMAGQCGF